MAARIPATRHSAESPPQRAPQSQRPRGTMACVWHDGPIPSAKAAPEHCATWAYFGAREENRTPDLRITSALVHESRTRQYPKKPSSRGQAFNRHWPRLTAMCHRVWHVRGTPRGLAVRCGLPNHLCLVAPRMDTQRKCRRLREEAVPANPAVDPTLLHRTSFRPPSRLTCRNCESDRAMPVR